MIRLIRDGDTRKKNKSIILIRVIRYILKSLGKKLSNNFKQIIILEKFLKFDESRVSAD
jgi:hypothetical protein